MEKETAKPTPRMDPPKSLSSRDKDYYYAKDTGTNEVSPAINGKAKIWAPVAEVAPRKSFTEEKAESEDEKSGMVSDKEKDASMSKVISEESAKVPLAVVERLVAPVLNMDTAEDQATALISKEPKSRTKRVVIMDQPSVTGSNSDQGRLSTAEILVALSERRRSQAIAATTATRRRRKSSGVDGDFVDPLRANVQMFRECFALIQRNKRQLVFNSFLILLVAMILSSMIVFAFFAPQSADFEIVLTPWATFWPLVMRLRLYQPSDSEAGLTLSLGGATSSYRPPSYCACCADDAPRCDSRHKQNQCWCFKWQQARLYISSVNPPATDAECLMVEWRSSSKQRIRATDCFRISFDDGVRWYGGPLAIDQAWPININNTQPSFMPYMVSDVQSEPGGLYGALEPLWTSDNGFAIMASLDNPFLVNTSDVDVCLRSDDLTKAPLKYMACRADDSRTYTINLTTLNDYVTMSSYPELEREVIEVGDERIVGKIFINYDSAEVSADEITAMQKTMVGLKTGFGITFENFDLFNTTMSENLIESIREAERASEGEIFPLKAVELNNFAKLHHLEGPEGQRLQEKCVTQSDKRTLGVSEWRGGIYACLDITRTDVAEWFYNLCSNHVINNITDYFSFSGGDASSLPVLPNLNISTTQTNFYSTIYARLTSSIPNAFLVDVAYNTHQLANVYVNVDTSSDNVRSMIPLMLTMSLQGYSRFAFNLVNYSTPAAGWQPTPENTDPLFTWLELAMFTPVFRIPKSILDWCGFEAVVKRFLPFRERIVMKYYEQAAYKYTQTGDPIYKPIWWMDYEDYRKGKYSTDEAKVWANDRQFMLGENLMVAAFLQTGDFESMVYFPPGRWRDVETQAGVVEGGKFVYVDTAQNVACFERVK